MEELQNPVTEDIISLTLEVITLLTGEDYDVVRRCGGSDAPLPGTPTSKAASRGHSPVLQLRRRLPTQDLESDKKILEATNKIIHLLTGEVWKFLAAVKHGVTLHQESSECSQIKVTRDKSLACPEGVQQQNVPSIPKKENNGVNQTGDGGSLPGDEEDSTTFHLELIGLVPYVDGEHGLYKEQNGNPGDYNSPKHQIQPEVHHIKEEPMEEEINSSFPNVTPHSGGIKVEIGEENLPTGSEEKGAQPSAQTEPVRGEEKGPTNLYIQGGCSVHLQSTYIHPKTTPKTERIHECPNCHRFFSTYYNLMKHQKSHQGSKSIACPDCGKCFSRNSQYITHSRLHTGEKPYTCSVCNKSFRVRHSLTIHQRSHTGEKPYHCNICEKRFTTSANFGHHRKTHTGERPYSCEDCGKTFIHNYQLSKHRLSHSGN